MDRLRFFQRKRGMAFFIVITIMIVIMILVSSLLYFMFNETKMVSNYVDSTVALYIAEAGLEQALYEISCDIYRIKDYGWNRQFDKEDKASDLPLKTFSEIANSIAERIKGGRLVDVRVSYELYPFITQKYGQLKIIAEGEYRGINKKIEVVKNFYGFDGQDEGLVPGAWRTLFILNKQDFPHIGIDRDFIVKGEKVYMKESVIELGDQLVDKLCRWIDMGYGFFGGGVDLTNVDVLEGKIFKKYKKFKWKKILGIPVPSWEPTVEEYSNNVHAGVVFDEIPNFKSEAEYKKVATKYYTKKQAKDIKYKGYKLLNQLYPTVTYKKVVPFYGWGNWKNIPVKWYQFWKNPTKADDTSHPIELNGVTFVDGDVYIEGYYKGNGAIVATGNIYIGGDLIKWGGSHEVRKRSGLALISLKGEVIYKPHYDKDWSRYPKPITDLHPYIEASITAPKGFRIAKDTPGLLKFLTNLTIKGNLVVGNLDQKKLPYDVTIIEDKDLKELQQPLPTDIGLTHKYFIKPTLVSWVEYR